MFYLKTWLGICFLMSSFCLYAQEKLSVDIGGALRFNYNYSSWKDAQQKRGGNLGFNEFRLNTKVKYKSLDLNGLMLWPKEPLTPTGRCVSILMLNITFNQKEII